MATETIEKKEFLVQRQKYKLEIDHKNKVIFSNFFLSGLDNGFGSVTLNENLRDYKYIVIEGL